MNERIKELLAQAYDQAVPETWTTLSSEQLERVYEKLAELIVRECAKIAIDCDVIKYSDFRQGIAREIKEHFGVEE